METIDQTVLRRGMKKMKGIGRIAVDRSFMAGAGLGLGIDRVVEGQPLLGAGIVLLSLGARAHSHDTLNDALEVACELGVRSSRGLTTLEPPVEARQTEESSLK